MERCPKDRGVALKFFFGDSLTWDDVFDWHNAVILPLSRLPLAPLGYASRSPKGEKLKPFRKQNVACD